jgi:hypothetical protein
VPKPAAKNWQVPLQLKMVEGMQEDPERPQILPILFAICCHKQAETPGNLKAMAKILEQRLEWSRCGADMGLHED